MKNHDNLFERACQAYRRNQDPRAIPLQPSRTSSGQEGNAFVLRNGDGPLAAFDLTVTGRIGKRLDLAVLPLR